MIEKSDLKSIFVSIVKSIDIVNSVLRDHHRCVAIIAYQLGIEYGLSKGALMICLFWINKKKLIDYTRYS